MSSGPITRREVRSWGWISAGVSGPTARWSWCGIAKQILAVFASEWHGVLDDARHRLEPVVVELARKWAVAPDRLVYDKAGLGRSFGSYLWPKLSAASTPSKSDTSISRLRGSSDAPLPFDGAVGYFGAGKGASSTSTAAPPTPSR